jgi:hypothetical protein
VQRLRYVLHVLEPALASKIATLPILHNVVVGEGKANGGGGLGLGMEGIAGAINGNRWAGWRRSPVAWDVEFAITIDRDPVRKWGSLSPEKNRIKRSRPNNAGLLSRVRNRGPAKISAKLIRASVTGEGQQLIFRGAGACEGLEGTPTEGTNFETRIDTA